MVSRLSLLFLISFACCATLCLPAVRQQSARELKEQVGEVAGKIVKKAADHIVVLSATKKVDTMAVINTIGRMQQVAITLIDELLDDQSIWHCMTRKELLAKVPPLVQQLELTLQLFDRDEPAALEQAVTNVRQSLRNLKAPIC